MRIAVRTDRKPTHELPAVAVVLEEVVAPGDVRHIQTLQNFPLNPAFRARAVEYARLQAGAHGVELFVEEE